MLYDMTLVAYSPDGARLGNLPSPLEVNVGSPFDDVSSLTFTYPSDGAGVELLSQPVEVAVEFMSPGSGAWFEPPGMRFLKLEWSHDLLESVPVIRFTCPGYAWLLNKAVTQPPPASVKAANVTAARQKLTEAKSAYTASQAALRSAMGLPTGSVSLADYAPTVTNNGCWILTDGTPLAHKGVVTGTGVNKVSNWVAMPSQAARALAVVNNKTTMDASQGTLNTAVNNKSIARIFRRATPGTIMGTLLAEAKGRGRLKGLSYSFGSDTDSSGNPWTKALAEYELGAGTPLFSVLDTLTSQGLCDWRMVGRRLDVYNPDAALAVNRGGAVTLINGLDISDAPDKGTIANVVGELLFTGEAGMNFKLANASAPTPWGVWEGSVSQSGVDNVATGKTLGQAALVAGSAEQIESTRSLILTGENALLPFIHYDVGDFITAPGPTGAMDSMRVQQVTVTRGTDGVLAGSVILNDRFIEKSIKAGKKMAGVFGGSSSGGSGTITAPPLTQDNRVPEPPTLFSAEPSAYVSGSGQVEGFIHLLWEHTGLATDGTLQDFERFHLRAKTGNQPWQAFGITGPDDTEGGLGPLTVRDSRGNPAIWQVAVMVEATNGKFSSYSNVKTVQMVDDLEPPPVPVLAQSDVTTTYRTTAVTWNGKGLSGSLVVAMPADFLAVNVYEAPSETGEWRKVGSGEFAGLVYQSPDIMPLKPVWYCLTSVDRSGNESEKSVPFSVTPAKNVPLEEMYEELDAAKIILKNAGDILLDANASLKDKLGELDDGFDNLDASKLTIGYLDVANRIRTNAITTRELAADSVTANQLVTNSVIAAKIAANAVVAGKIAADAVTAREIKALSISAGLIAANAIGADQINAGSVRTAVLTANSVTAAILHGDAVNGMTITGAIIRTATTGRRTQIDSNGLRMWDGGSNLVLSQNASTGDISMRGDLSSRSFGGNQLWAGADMRNSGASGAAARAGIVFKSDATEYRAAALYRDGDWGAVMIDSPYSSTGSYNGRSTVSVANHGIKMWASKAGALTGPGNIGSEMLALNADGSWQIGGGGTSAKDNFSLFGGAGGLKVYRSSTHNLDFRSDRSTVMTTSKFDVAAPFYATSKNFKIRHPTKPGMDLYHGCTESPMSGVEYWGEAELDDRGVATVALPDYFEALTKQRNRAILVTPKDQVDILAATDIDGGHFSVTGTPNQRFTWLVKAERKDADFAIEQPTYVPTVEPDNS